MMKTTIDPLFAAYKASAPIEDFRLFVRTRATLSTELNIRCLRLNELILAQKGKHTKASKAEFLSIQATWRRDRLDADIILWNQRRAEEEAAEALALQAELELTEPDTAGALPVVVLKREQIRRLRQMTTRRAA